MIIGFLKKFYKVLSVTIVTALILFLICLVIMIIYKNKTNESIPYLTPLVQGVLNWLNKLIIYTSLSI
jgi:hypothetical protein